MMVFVRPLQTVVNSVLVSKKKTALASYIDFWSRMIYPDTLAVVLLVSFVI